MAVLSRFDSWYLGKRLRRFCLGKNKQLICNKFIKNVHGCPLAFRFLVVASLFVSLICDCNPDCRPTGGSGGVPPPGVCVNAKRPVMP